MNELPIDTKSKANFFVKETTNLNYPPVFVVDENSEEERFVWALMHECSISVERRNEIANENVIVVLNGLDVINHLSGEMDPDAEWFLREEVEQRWFLGGLEDYRKDSPVPFIIPPTERVLKFVAENYC